MKSGKRPTTINLDDETREIARSIGNLSWFVREALRTHRDLTEVKMVEDHTQYQIDLECCPPFGVHGTCAICWPDGPPLRREWMDFQRMRRAGMRSGNPPRLVDHQNLTPASALKAKPVLSDTRRPQDRRVGLLRRLWGWFY